MILRPYQEESIDNLRDSLRTHRSCLLQSPTGSGKTVLFSKITKLAAGRKKRVWIVVPRNELVRQTSAHLLKHDAAHGLITANSNESRAYRVHVVSKDTLIRRYDKIKEWPDLLLFDEGHLYLPRQIEIASRMPSYTKILSFTATPERLDGLGLGRLAPIKFLEDGTLEPYMMTPDYGPQMPGPNGLYEDIVWGESIHNLTELEFLSPMRYFAPELPGIEELHRRGTEYNPDELEALFKKRNIFGSVLSHWREYAEKRSTMVFCRSVKAAEEWAHNFRQAGYNFEHIEGNMSQKKQKTMVDALKDGRLHGLTNCELATYGVDVPRVECVVGLRPTDSPALYYQINGRGFRPFKDEITGYVKKDCVMLDHVGNFAHHASPEGETIAQRFDREWQFYGTLKAKRRRGPSAAILKLCPKCFMYTTIMPCENCGNAEAKSRRGLKEIDGRLVEIEGPVKLNDRPDEERREYVDRINADVAAYQEAERTGEIDESAVADLLKAAEELGRGAMWVYWTLSSTYLDKDGVRVPRKSVNSPLLYAIGRIKGYKQGWAWMKKDEIRQRINSNDAEVEMFRREVG